MALPSIAAQAYIAIRAFFNPQLPGQQTINSWSSPDSFQANGAGQTTIQVPGNAVDYAVNFATLFPGLTLPVFVSLADLTNPGIGFTWSTVVAGLKQSVAASGFIAWSANQTVNTVYVNNPTINILVLQVGVISK